MLKISDLSLYYGDALALDGVSLEVKEKEIVALIGANGAGKTSLVKAIAGILKPKSGSIKYRGQEIGGLPSHIVCNLGVNQVAEGRQIFPNLTVFENLEMGAVIPRAKPFKNANLDYSFSLFPRLKERIRQQAGTLSGGEQQMLAIARAIMGNPELIMFDEPSLGLAPAIVGEVFKIIETLNQKGLTILLIEQNVAASLKLAARGYVLENGQISLQGKSQELSQNPQVRQAYLGI